MRRFGCLLLTVGLAAGQTPFVEWTIPTPNSQPHCVVSDSRGRIWYAAIGVNQVGMFDPAKQEFRELRVPTPNAQPHGIAVTPDDTIWFTEEGANKIGRIAPATFEITEYPLPNPNSAPHTPIYDGRGGLWFTEQNGNRIGRLNIRTGQIEEFTVPTPNSGPYGIITDAEGNAWFCAFGPGSNRIGRVDARTGAITEYRTPTANSGPRRPWIDSRGRIWFTENRANKLGMFDPATEQFKEWGSPSPNGQPYGIVIDFEDQVWYNEFNSNTMVRFDPAGEKFTVFPFPGPRASVRIVAVDPFNRIWYGDNGNSKIGMVPSAHSAVNAASFRANSSVAPGAIVAIFGSNVAGATQQASAVPLPTTLGDTSVTFNGIAAPLFFISSGQVNAQAPFELPAGTVTMQVSRGGTVTLTQSLAVAESAPGIFTVNRQGTGAGVIVHASDFRLVNEDAPARPGEFVSIFCTGLGRLRQPVVTGGLPPNPPPETVSRPQVSIANLPAEVIYAGVAPGFVGLYQVNVQVPPGAPAGGQPVRVILNGARSNIVTMAIQ